VLRTVKQVETLPSTCETILYPRCCIMVMVAVFVFVEVWCIAGDGTVLGIGIAQQEELKTLDAEADSTLLPEKCTIRSVEHCWRTEWREEGEGRRRPICFDTWQPTFTYKDTAYECEIEETERCI